MKSYENKKVLITGGLGFIGSNLARKLASLGANVTVLDSLIPEYGGNLQNLTNASAAIKINFSDVRDEYSLNPLLKDCQYLFNLAGQTSHLDSMLHPKIDLDINVGAQISILEVTRRVAPEIKIVYAGTRQVYGKPIYLPVDELHPINPVDVNGINKFAGEMYHLLYSKTYGIKSCILRLTNTYGPGMRIKDARQTFLGVWVKNILLGEKIKVFGDGLQLRDLNYIDDCVAAMLQCGLSDDANGKIYNLGSKEVINLKDLAKLITSLGFGGEYEMVPFPADRKIIDIGDYFGDYSRISSEIGWEPKVLNRDGLKKTLEYYQEFLKSYLS